MVMDHLHVRSLWILHFVLVVLDDDPARMNGATRRQCSGKAKAMISSLVTSDPVSLVQSAPFYVHGGSSSSEMQQEWPLAAQERY